MDEIRAIEVGTELSGTTHLAKKTTVAVYRGNHEPRYYERASPASLERIREFLDDCYGGYKLILTEYDVSVRWERKH